MAGNIPPKGGIYGGKKSTVTSTGYGGNAPVKKTPQPASHDAAAQHASNQAAHEAHAKANHPGDFNPHADHQAQQQACMNKAGGS